MAVYGATSTLAPAGAIILNPGDNVSAIVGAAPVGATFYFEAGVYRGVSLAPKDGQTFIGAEGAILDGSAVLTNWTQSGNLYVIGGQTQQGTVNRSAEFLSSTQAPGHPDTVFVDNVPLKAVDSLSKVVSGTFYFDYAADKIYIADNPTGHTVEAGKLTDAFHGNASNVTIENLVVEKYDPPIQNGAINADNSRSQNWIIQNNEVRLNYAVGITASNGAQIIGNYVHDNGELGVGGDGNNILVQGNELASNGFWSGIDPLWEAGGLKFSDTDNLVVRDNYSHDNNGSGLWTDTNNIHTLYEGNLVVHNTINGISHEISYDAIIRNNTLIGNGYGDTRGWGWGAEINIQNSQNVDVYGNKVDMTGGGNGIVLIQQNRGSGTHGAYLTVNDHIHDNTIVDHDGHGYIGAFADYNLSGMLNGGNTWANDQYFMADGRSRFQWGGSESFAQFQNAAHETGSISQSYPDTSGWLTPPAGDTAGGTTGGTAGAPAGGTTGGTAGAPAGGTTGGTTGDPTGGTTGGTTGDPTGGTTGGTSGSAAGGTTGGSTTTGDLTLTGDGHVTGGPGNDHLYGGAGNDFLDGGHGADVMAGGGGNDTYYVDNAGDQVIEAPGGGTDTVYASVNWTLGASQEVEFLKVSGNAGLTLTGNELGNSLTGGPGNDHLNGGGGNDTLDGGTGADVMAGGSGNDTYYVGNSSDQVIEAAGGGTDAVYTSVSWTLGAGQEIESATITSTSGRILTGNELANILNGGVGNDTLRGGAGNDHLNGGAGNDRLDGGTGNDTLNGGTGRDTFVIGRGAGQDVVQDFQSGVDHIDISAWHVRSVGRFLASAVESGGNTTITLSSTASIELDGVHLSQLHSSDFILR